MSSALSDYPGERFGAPRDGVGAVPSFGQRAIGFLVDIVVAALISWIFTAPEPPLNWSLLTWAVVEVLGIGLLGVTPGHLLIGTRVATLRPVGRGQLVGLWALPRAVLVGVLLPPILIDFDGRGLHDRLCRTIVVRSR